jgi:hypothetical protein
MLFMKPTGSLNRRGSGGWREAAVVRAYEQQSFDPLGTPFHDEESALAVYERAVSKLAEAEERWFALSAALAYEKEMTLKGQVSRSRMN